MKRIILTAIAGVALLYGTYAQCTHPVLNAAGQVVYVQTSYDTISVILPVMDTTSWYIIYKPNGSIYQKLTSIQSYSVPANGWVSVDAFVNNEQLFMKGFVVYKTYSRDSAKVVTEAINFLDTKRKNIPKPYVVNRWPVPPDGLGLNPLSQQIK